MIFKLGRDVDADETFTSRDLVSWARKVTHGIRIISADYNRWHRKRKVIPMIYLKISLPKCASKKLITDLFCHGSGS